MSAVPAILPGPGTTAEVSAALGDLAYLTAAQIELVLKIACLYDRRSPTMRLAGWTC